MLPSQRSRIDAPNVSIKIEAGEVEIISADEGIITHVYDYDDNKLITFDGDVQVDKQPL